MTAASRLEWGVVQHYVPNSGFGFLRREGDADEINNIYFHITSCNVQTPPPRVGELVLFSRSASLTRASAAAVRRVSITGDGGTGEDIPPLVDPSALPPGQDGREKLTAVRRQEPIWPPHEAPSGNWHRGNDRPPDLLPKSAKVKQRMLADAPSFFRGSACPRYVYVDLDNIWVSFVRAEHLVAQFPGATTTRDLMLDLDGFTRRLGAGDPGSSVKRLVAFYFHTPEAIAARLRKLSHDGVSWEVIKQETTTDTTMQLELLNVKRPCSAHPKTLVLVTGDGNIAPNGMCFREIMDLYLRDGWFVEVHAWLFTLARSYIEFQRAYASSVVIRVFDDTDVGDITYRSDQYASVIRQLEGSDGDLFVPTGLAMLERSGAVDASSAIYEADDDTQLLLLKMALLDAMDAATMRELQAEHGTV